MRVAHLTSSLDAMKLPDQFDVVHLRWGMAMAVEGNSNSQQVNSFPLLHHHHHRNCDQQQQLRKRKSRCCVFLKPRMEDLKQQAHILMTMANENEFDVQFLSLPRPRQSELGLHSNEIERLPSYLVVIAWLRFWELIVQLGLPWS